MREISTQSKFALIAWSNLNVKAVASGDVAFSSIHSFLSHAANISKLLKAPDIEDPGIINVVGGELGILPDSVIHDRRLRNNLEHYDQRLKEWLKTKGVMANIGTYNLGPKGMFNIQNLVYVTHYDPDTKIFTFVDEDFDLYTIAIEIQNIQSRADKWVENNRITVL